MTRYFRHLAMSTAVLALPAAAADDFQTAYDSITGEAIAADVAVLASDAFEGRGPGGTGEARTVAHIEQAFRAAGIAPGVGNAYVQPFDLAQYTREHGRLALRSPSGPVAFEAGTDFVQFAGRPEAMLTLPAGRVVFGGFGIVSPAHDWDDYGDMDLEGATVILFRGDPGTVTGDDTLFDGTAMTQPGLVGSKLETAAARGAAAVLLIHTDASAGYPWATLSSGGVGGTQFFLMESDTPQLDTMAHISEPAARRIFQAAGLDFDEMQAAAAQPGFRARETGLTASGGIEGQLEPLVTRNVIGMIEGREAPHECIIYTAHWDHMGINPDAPTDDTVFNGALDNATGTAMLINIARAYAALDEAPRRSVYFFATAAEERGFLGTKHYIANPSCELTHTIGVFNMDAHFPYADHWNAMVVPGLGTSELEEEIRSAANRLGRTLIDDSSPEAGGFFRSDHWPFIEAGVPGIYAVGSPDEAQIEGDPAILPRFEAYMTGGYHHAADEYDAETWLMGGIEGDARIFFEAGWSLANSQRYPNFRYDSPWRPLRDGMMAID